MPLRFFEVKDLVLYEAYWLFSFPEAPDDADESVFRMALEGETSERFFDAAFEKLLSEHLLERIGVLPNTYGITLEGIAYIDERIADPESFLSERHRGRDSTQVQFVPASGRYVGLDHNSEVYSDAIKKVEVAVRAIQESNAEVKYDKDQIINELSAGQKLLQSTKVKVAAALAILISPLYTVYHDAAAEALKPHVLSAIRAIEALLGF